MAKLSKAVGVTDVAFLFDASGSMASIRGAALAFANATIASFKDKPDTFVTAKEFGGSIRDLIDRTPAAQLGTISRRSSDERESMILDLANEHIREAVSRDPMVHAAYQAIKQGADETETLLNLIAI